ncbi:MAG TPA: amino acid ABC transporter permease [Dongiaceae bacterium]|jgi:polar amino acid transport system permease protein|nr:amino acid ABC transporter permease [Dongiaceae bacterium]
MPLALAAFAVSAAILLFAWFTLTRLDLALTTLEANGTGARIILIAIGLCLLYPLRFTLRSFGALRRSRRALRGMNVIEARVGAAAARQSAWIAVGLSGAVLIGALVVQFFIANNLAVSRTFFYLPLIRSTFGDVLGAAWVNVYIFTVSEVLVLIWALVIAIARQAPGPAGRPIRMIATAYTDIFRGLPAIINVYLIGFGISLTGLPYLKDWSSPTFAIIALTLTSSAYVAEVYRAGIESIHWSQTAASRSLGLSHGQTLRFVVVPQAVRRILPPLLNNFIGLQKDTALVNVIGALDAFNQAKIIASSQFNLSAVSTVAFLFVLITIPQARFVDRLIERQRRASQA